MYKRGIFSRIIDRFSNTLEHTRRAPQWTTNNLEEKSRNIMKTKHIFSIQFWLLGLKEKKNPMKFINYTHLRSRCLLSAWREKVLTTIKTQVNRFFHLSRFGVECATNMMKWKHPFDTFPQPTVSVVFLSSRCGLFGVRGWFKNILSS